MPGTALIADDRARRLGIALGFLVGAMLVALASGPAAAAPKADLWPRWEAHDPAALQRIDHSAWDTLLAAHVIANTDGVNRFTYGSVSTADRAALDSYIALLEATPISAFNRDEQFAYWVNFYNALTVKVILDNLPVDSITDIDISPGLFANGPWGAKLVTVEGEDLSLDDIEHRILRPIWRDPRIHYVVNCASIGCPNLHPKALTGDTYKPILDETAAAYINHPRGARVEDGDLIVSSIYSWFEEDFGDSEAGVIAHLKEYAEPALAAALAERSGYDDDEYDWSLNGG